jgi:hypothetical protein
MKIFLQLIFKSLIRHGVGWGWREEEVAIPGTMVYLKKKGVYIVHVLNITENVGFPIREFVSLQW